MDCTALLANKSSRPGQSGAESNEEAQVDPNEVASSPSSWVLEEYNRLWAEGIMLELAKPARANRSLHGERDIDAVQLVKHYGLNLKRLDSIYPEITRQVIGTVRETLLVNAKSGSSLGDSARSLYLGRLVYIVDELNKTLAETSVQQGLDGIYLEIANQSSDSLCNALETAQPKSDQEVSIELRLLTRLIDETGPMTSQERSATEVS